MSALAEHLDVHASTMTRMCNRLVGRGLVVRTQSVEDRREVLVTLSEAGRELVDDVGARRRREIDVIVHRLPEHARRTVVEALDSFVRARGDDHIRAGAGARGRGGGSMKQYTLPDLPYDYAALEPHYSARVLELHHDKHHAAYVKGVNATLEKLEKARAEDDYSSLVGLEKTLAFNLSGHVLHSIFWRNLSPDGGGKPDGELGNAINEYFGSFDQFRAPVGSGQHDPGLGLGRAVVGTAG